MYFCAGHYRQPIDFDEARLEQAAVSVRRVREAARRLTAASSPGWSAPIRERFFAALADDFNTPRALAALFDWVRTANRASTGTGGRDLREMLDVLGLGNLLDRESPAPPPELVHLSERREQARAAGDYAEADRIRAEILARGWELRDGVRGPELLRSA